MDGGFKAERSEPPFPGDFVQDDVTPFSRIYLALENIIYNDLKGGLSFKQIGEKLNDYMTLSQTIQNKYFMLVEEP